MTDLQTRPVLDDDTPGEDDGVPCLWAWIALDAPEGECIASTVVPVLGGVVSLVTSYEDIARGMMRRIVLMRLPNNGQRYELRRYNLAEVVEQL